MNLKFIKSSEKKKFLQELKEQFGITKLPYLLMESGKEKIRAYSGSLSKEELRELSNALYIEGIGIYLIKKESPIRLSFDAPHILKDQISKNVLEITEEDYQNWIRGNDLDIQKPRGTYIISYNGDFVGLGKSNEERIINHVPKDRRIKNPLEKINVP